MSEFHPQSMVAYLTVSSPQSLPLFTRLYYSSNHVLKEMWPDGQLGITEVTKRPLTAATLFKNSIVALVDKLACKVSGFLL